MKIPLDTLVNDAKSGNFPANAAALFPCHLVSGFYVLDCRERSMSHLYQPISFEGRSIALGVYGAAHLGDLLCSTPVVRLLAQEMGVKVYVEDGSGLRSIFANNPYVAGFTKDASRSLDQIARGSGHVIQRLLQGFELPLNTPPRPEIYFSQAELDWVAEEKSKWQSTKPVCLISTRAFTDAAHLRGIDWKQLAQAVSECYTIVQPVLTHRQTYESQVAQLGHHHWLQEWEIPGALIYRDLPLRHYLALFKAVDLFVGPPSGGSHIAAALGVSALILIWKEIENRLRFPVPANQKSVDIFLYPQHSFMSVEELAANPALLQSRLCDLYAQLKNSQAEPTVDLGTPGSRSWEVAPRNPQRIVFSTGQRIRKVPGIYGDGHLASPWQWQ